MAWYHPSKKGFLAAHVFGEELSDAWELVQNTIFTTVKSFFFWLEFMEGPEHDGISCR